MPVTEPVFAPAKINLTLHVTGQRADGYHLLDSLVMFANVGDRLWVRPAQHMHLRVTGPFAHGVPTDRRNLCWRAAELFGEAVEITLEKNLPHPAGIGGGSSDAAAVIRAMEQLFDRALPGDALTLGADVPVCLTPRAARMQGIGEAVSPVEMPNLQAILINPGVDLPTGAVFGRLHSKDNPAMSALPDPATLWNWLADQRNDLEPPAQAVQPVIKQVLAALETSSARLSRMSGSGATCFGLYDADADTAEIASQLQEKHRGWWIMPTILR
ncbi:MAG: 4-(cytidine 5'-diphospho)-2-C-methyl-D-erythritol kinase [Pelagimonas sp.]|jgi:4-diphosphocytidyl-2-C-methyl-D-erythritol kinase|nr:4-(cytidine 5'-diphospho)-2-C-methyl-D-erythritol kinase [Pelagimonas sp.]